MIIPFAPAAAAFLKAGGGGVRVEVIGRAEGVEDSSAVDVVVAERITVLFATSG